MEMIERKIGLMGMDWLKKHRRQGVTRRRIDVIKSRTTWHIARSFYIGNSVAVDWDFNSTSYFVNPTISIRLEYTVQPGYSRGRLLHTIQYANLLSLNSGDITWQLPLVLLDP
jgi:hypothetical protein